MSNLSYVLSRLTEQRARHPEQVAQAWSTRRRRPWLDTDGRLLLVAADHPARGALRVGADESAMADRHDLLGRLLRALDVPGVDGVLATPDVLEDLLLLGALEGRLAVGSTNRGGLAGAVFELDDRPTAYDVATLCGHGLDGGKALVRICPDDPGTAATLESTGRLVTAMAAAGRPVVLEPFWCLRDGDRLTTRLDVASVQRSVAVASGLGATSAYTWLKLPVVPDLDQVMRSTTLPTLLLGGDPDGGPDAALGTWRTAMQTPGVRGLVVGRALLYPSEGDVADVVRAAARLVHGG